MKKTLKTIIFLILILFIISPRNIFAYKEPVFKKFTIDFKKVTLPVADVVVDGKAITEKNAGVDPVIIESRTLVPVRFMSENLGYKVLWEAKTEKVSIQSPYKTIELFIGKDKAIIDGVSEKMTDSVPPKIINQRTMVPIRFVVEQMGMSIDYDANLNRVFLDTSSVVDTDTIIFNESKKDDLSETANPVIQSPAIVQQKHETKTPEIKKPADIDNDTTVIDDILYASKGKLNYSLSKSGIEQDFIISSTSENLEFSHFYINDPQRLVIDIPSAVLDRSMKPEDNFADTFFVKLTSAYHIDIDKTRIVLRLEEGVSKDDISVIKNANTVTVKYKKNVSKNISTDFGRLSGSVTVCLTNPFTINNNSQSDIEIIIPKNVGEFLTGTISGENNLVNGITVEDMGRNYKISGQLKKNVSFSLQQTSEKKAVLNFTKKFSSPPLIVLDAGHGGNDPGAISKVGNYNEKTLNLQVLLKLEQELRIRGYEIYTTRNDDSFITLNDIAEKANNAQGDIFISLHHNSATSTTVSGIETYYSNCNDSKELADSIQRNILRTSGASNRGIKDMGFVVLKRTYMPAVLVELGFMSNPTEVQKNATDSYQNILVQGIADGVDEYFRGKI